MQYADTFNMWSVDVEPTGVNVGVSVDEFQDSLEAPHTAHQTHQEILHKLRFWIFGSEKGKLLTKR